MCSLVQVSGEGGEEGPRKEGSAFRVGEREGGKREGREGTHSHCSLLVPECVYNGVKYRHLESFPSDVDCNTW